MALRETCPLLERRRDHPCVILKNATGRLWSRIILWLFLTFSVFYMGITRGHFIGTDEIAVYRPHVRSGSAAIFPQATVTPGVWWFGWASSVRPIDS